MISSNDGTGIASGGLADFGLVEPDGTKDFTIMLKNSGNGLLQLTGSPKLVISGTHAGQFSLTVAFATASVEPSGSVNFTIRFTPTGGGGLRNATLTIANNDPNEGSYVVNLKATVGTPDIDVLFGNNSVFIASSNNDAGKMADVGTVRVGESNTAVFTIKNTGNAALKLTGTPKVAVSGTNGELFSIEPALSLASIPANGSANFTVKFTPKLSNGTWAGVRNATLTIPSNDPDEGSFVVKLKGTAMAPDVDLRSNGSSIGNGSTVDFGTVNINDKKNLTFTIANTGSAPLVLALGNNGRLINNNNFYQSVNLGNTTLAPNQTADVVVTFNPRGSAGDFTDKITLSSNDPADGSFVINLKGKGLTAPEIDVTYSGLSGVVSVPSGGAIPNTFSNKNKRTFTYTIKNTGSKELKLTGNPKVTVSGPDAARVTLLLSSTIATVAPGQSTSFSLEFLPTVSKLHEFTVTIPNDDADEGSYVLNFKFTVQ